MKTIATTLTIALAFALVFGGSLYAAGDAAAGKAVFASKCVSCHGADGEGKPAIAKMMKVEMKPLSSKEVQAKSDAELTKDMKEGVGKMKPVGGLKDKDYQDIVAHLRTLGKK